jgi:hypothetical protein
MHCHRAEFMQFLLDEPFEQYVQRMSTPQEWGDDMSLVAAAKHYGLTVHLIRGHRTSEETVVGDGDRHIFLTYCGVHYDATAEDVLL